MAERELSLQQYDMIALYLKGENISDIARKLNVNRKTIYNWLDKENVKAELDKRRRDLTTQANQILMKDITTYIENIQALARDNSDKRVCLAANQYLINRIYGNPTNSIVTEDKTDNKKEDFDLDILDEVDLSKVIKLKNK
ncbi:helix-turn-helix domain-containing protein [Romboutsia sp. 1001216sp1]|uniref:helix-turn-helix domain-containing protein n=1 Tax=Romboutsia sp. 1001216sp1 TaxID=2986997 RepID=UPI00232B44AE|nr:helix-turn-helix domain-containing protein [Romboutsia sp. 1001216sp1]MDB8790521.1 helix-turn-helix domain-containing protein [Romboutsia sp. 1001216sp1]